MKKLMFPSFLFCLFLTTAFFANKVEAQTNTGIFFQAVARDVYSNPAKDRKIYIQSSIIQNSPTGTKVLVEEHQSQTDATGVFSISVGQGTRKEGTAANLTSIEWAKGPYYLNLKISIVPIAPAASWDYTKEWLDIGTTPFGTVPYALYSGSSGALDSKLNIADTAKMLALYAKAQIVQSLSTAVATKISTNDTSAMLAPYKAAVNALVASNITSLTAAAINSALDSKLNIADSITIYVTPTQLAAKTFDSTAIYNQLGLKANKTYVDAQVAGATIADADVNTKGKLQLAGDLTGTAASPTIANNAITTNKVADGAIVNSKIASGIDGSKINGNISGNAATATKIATPVTINGVSFDGSSNITISSAAANALTMNNSGAGDVSGTLFDGSSAKTISYNTIGASPLAGSSSLTTVGTINSGIWSGTTIALSKGGTGAINAADARSNLGLTIGTDVMAANAITTLTGDVAGSGNGNFVTTVNSVGGVSSSTISTLPTSVNTNTASITTLNTNVSANTASITAETTRATNAESGLDTRIASNTNSITSNIASIGTLNSNVSSNTASITAETTRATNAETGLDTRITSNTNSITSNIASIATLNTNVSANTASITTLNNNVSTNTSDILLRAPLASPAFTGVPTAPTPATNDNSTTLATTAYVKASITAANAGVSSVGPISGTSNANGGTISGSTQLILAPADANFGGVVTTATQTFAGSKTFTNTVTFGTDITVNGIKIGKGGGNNLANTAIGSGALALNNSGSGSTAFGYNTLSKSTGGNATAFGTAALENLTTGTANVAVGYTALNQTSTQNSNTAVGDQAMRMSTGANNTALGASALYGVAGQTNGNNNTAIGNFALKNATTAAFNVGVGSNSLNNITSGNDNTVFGYQSGYLFGAGTGANLTSMSQGVLIGSNVRAGTNTSTNEIAIGYNVVGNGSNTVTIGNYSNTANYFRGDINLTGNVNGGTWSGTAIANNKLANSSLTIGSTNIELGASSNTLSGISTVTSSNFTGNLTGDVTGNLTGNASSTTKLATARNINGVSFDGTSNITIAADANTLTGTTLANNVVNSSLTSVGTITSGVWSGTAIANNKLENSSLTIGSTNIALGASSNTLAGLSTVTSTNFTGNLIGNASTATKIANSVTINGVSFDGSSNITIASAAANSLTMNNSGTGDISGSTFDGSTTKTISYNTIGASPLAGSSSLTTVGTIISGTWSGSIIDIAHGGTGSSTVIGAKTNLGLNNVENTALSTWAGSSNITTVGALTAQTKTFMFQDLILGYGANNGAKIQTDASNKYLSFYPNYNIESTRMWPSGNVTIQHGGTFTDNGYALDVKGSSSLASVNITNSTTSTSTTTGALVVAGGAGISGDVNIGGNINSGTWSGSTIAIEKGGTGANTASAARSNLGLVIGTNVQSPITLGATSLAAGGTFTSVTGLSSVGATSFTGNLTGNVTGDVTGNLVGNATTATTAGNITATSNSTLTSLPSLVQVGTISSGVWSGTAIADTKLATITTAGKVLNSATTATDANIASAIVARDASGNFTANTITATLSGTASTANKLTTARNINGVSFDGTSNITIAADANTLSGTTLASNVVSSSLTSVGTITSGTWSGSTIAIEKGGTGATNASAARTNLGLVIGTNVQSPITLGTTSLAAGGTFTSVTGLSSVGATNFTGNLTGNVTGNVTGDVTGNLAGNATTATTAGNITATSNTTLNSLANLATVGTITSGTWSGSVIGSNVGGAGTVNGLLKANGSGVVSAAVAGTDYQTPLTAGTSYVVPNSSITGATKTKITYDTKGLVTAGADATTADIAPSTNRNYVTDAQAGVLSNTSGTNTGDETATTIRTKLGITTLSGSNTGDQTITLTGDVTGTGTGTFTTTMANSGVTANTYGSSTLIPTITVDAKGRITSANTTSIIANAGTLTGTSLASNVTGSSLTGVATITSGTWNGSTIGLAYGGTGLTSPGTSGNVLTSNGTAWVSQPISAVTSLGTFTTTSYVAGGTISGSTLTLSAADATNPGLVSTGTQIIGGAKTFSNTTTFSTDILVRGINIGRGPNNNQTTNTAIGASALNSSSVLTDNVAVGYRSLYIGSNTSGYNTAVGSMSGYGHTTGDFNSFFGYNAGYNSSTGFRNTIIGANAVGYGTITGSSNQALGYSSLYNLTSGYNNTAIGDSALYSTTSGYNNVGIGHRVLKDNTSGDYNIALGLYALNSNTSGNQNIGIGAGALYTNNTGINNVGIGYEALNFNGSYSNNIAIGKGAGKYYASWNQPARGLSDNIFIGVDAWPLNSSDANSIVIGNSTATNVGAVGLGSNSTSIGNTLTQQSRIYGALTVVPNTAATSTNGASSTIAAQNAGSGGNNNGGSVSITAGTPVGTGAGGNITLTPGVFSGNASSTSGYVNIPMGTTNANWGVNVSGSVDDFLEYNIKNNSTGTKAQSGFNAIANNGTETTNFVWMGINNQNFNNPQTYNVGSANDVTFMGAGNDLHVANANYSKSIIFSTGTATTPYFSERMRITATGNVGIGTNSPTANLEVTGTTKLVGAATFSSTVSIPTGAAAGKVLTSDAIGLASWTYSIGSTVVTSTTTYAITLAEAYVFYTGTAAGAFTIPDPSSTNAGKEITIKNKTAYGITITPATTGKIYIDNANSAANSVSIGIEASNNWIKLISDGAQWNVIRALF